MDTEPVNPGTLSKGRGNSYSKRSLLGLNAVNFLLADAAGVVGPFLNDFLREQRWRYDSIALATAIAGLGVMLAQTPAGYLIDHTRRHRTWLIAGSLITGSCLGVLPLLPPKWWIVDPLVFTSGIAGTVFAPVLAAMALGLVGNARLNKIIGDNQAWNHAGNIAAALTAMLLISIFSIRSVFFAIGVVSALAAMAALLIRPEEIDVQGASGLDGEVARPAPAREVGISELLRERTILVLLASTALFHLANAPILPMVGLYLKSLHGSDRQVAATVLTAQTVMIPVAWATGWLCDRWGRKPTLGIAFVVLPLRILLYSFTRSPSALVALQCFDGIGAGIYGVAIVAICADVTKGKGRFNTLMGLVATALSLGGVLGPLIGGNIVQHLGFAAAFRVFAGLAAVGAVAFLFLMPETRPEAADTAREIAALTR